MSKKKGLKVGDEVKYTKDKWSMYYYGDVKSIDNGKLRVRLVNGDFVDALPEQLEKL